MVIISNYNIFHNGKNSFSIESKESALCPICHHPLKLRDHVPRILKSKKGEVRWLHIRRLRCSNPACHTLHRELPDILAPFKHFETDVIAGVLEELITSETHAYEDHPCESTMRHWHHWLYARLLGVMDGSQSLARRPLPPYAKTAAPPISAPAAALLHRLMDATANWLKVILRHLYNSGHFLSPGSHIPQYCCEHCLSCILQSANLHCIP